MPISKSAKKALRVATRKTAVNRHRKALIKEALKAVSMSDKAEVSTEALSKAVSAVDKGAKWGIFHPNKAARLKSQLTKKVGSPAKKATSTNAQATSKATKPAVKKTAPKKAAVKKSATKKTAK